MLYPVTIFGRAKRPGDPQHYITKEAPPGVGWIYRPREEKEKDGENE